MKSKKGRKAFLVGASLLATASAAPAFCQTVSLAHQSAPADAQAADAMPGDIVVTAQKRAQSLQSVAASITALGSESLAAMGRQDVTALAGKVPSLQVNQYSPTITIFNLRGVSQNDFADSQEAPIAFYADEVYVASLGAISGQNFDLERVEVLRGPQGTLFGRNATGGLIQIVSAKPTDHLEAFATLTGGSYGQFASEGAISGPLAPGLRARLSFTSDNHGGYIRNLLGPSIGNSKFYGFRLQFAVDIAPGGELLLKAQRLRNDHERSGGLYSFVASRPGLNGLGVALGSNEDYYGTGPGADPFGNVAVSNDPFVQAFDRTPSFDRTVSSLTARYTQQLGDVTLVSITDYQKLRKAYGEDSDMSALPIFNFDTHQRFYQFSQETRLNGKVGNLTWLAGVYGLHINSVNGYTITSPAGVLPSQDYGGTTTTDSFAAFGQVEFELTHTLTAVLGGRYSRDVKKLDFVHATDGVQDFVFNPTIVPSLARRVFPGWSGRAELQYSPRRGFLAYLSVNRGTKSGGFGTQAFTPIDPTTIPFGSEVLTSYEAGLKLTLLDRALTVNGAIFHYDYDDYQAFAIVSLSQFIRNNPAKINGGEIEVVLRPARGLTMQAFGTYLDTKVRNISLPDGTLATRVLPQAPKVSLGGLLRYEFDAGSGRIGLQTDWKYDSMQYFSTFNAPIDREGPRAVGNARISYAIKDGAVESALVANNVLDRRYRIYNLDLSSALGVSNQTYARPRWIGGSVTFRTN